MSPANGRPLPPSAPNQGSESAEGGDRRSTGVRARSEGDVTVSGAAKSEPATSASSAPDEIPSAISAGPVISQTAGVIPLAEGIRNNSIAPEALRKPYASLAPQPKKTPTSPGRSAAGPRPQLESFHGMEDELTGVGQANPGQSAPSSGKTKSTRSICSKHKIARGKNGECMLCRKEEISKSGGLGWKLMVAFIVLAVLVSAAIAASVKLQHL